VSEGSGGASTSGPRTPAPRLLAVSVGRVRAYGAAWTLKSEKRPWSSGIAKIPVVAGVRVGPEGVVGDEQADRANHGGVDKAVHAYSADHYTAWRAELGLPLEAWGAMGENLTIKGLIESSVCIGDRYRMGTAVFEVSQPRQPCWKFARHLGVSDMVKRVLASGRTGWYLRVIESGEIEAGDAVELVDRPWPEWTLDRANAVMHGGAVRDGHAVRDGGSALAADRASLAACPALSESWRDSLVRREQPGRPP
jgi:MOSC domain-containing protein YiiM